MKTRVRRATRLFITHRRIRRALVFSAFGTLALGAALSVAQSGSHSETPFGTPSAAVPKPSADITAVRGDRGDRQWSEQSRSEVLARHGIVATSQPLAAQAGLKMLQDGGTAADAAVAGAAALAVVEPNSTGLGGDLFAIYYSARDRKLHGINASGWAPSAWTPEYFKGLGFDETTGLPEDGVHSINVPGAIDGWWRLQRRFGRKSFARALDPAVKLAEQGFGMTENIHSQWQDTVPLLRRDPDSVATFLRGGEAPALYSIFKNPEVGRALRLLQQDGPDAFYRGEIGRAIVAKIRAIGGAMTMDDLGDFRSEWIDPISTNYHGYDVYEMPPNTQGFVLLEMLNILETCVPKLGYDLAALGPRSPQYWHFLVEAKKLAYDDLDRYNADPRFARVPLDRLISKEYAATLCNKIDPAQASTPTMKVGVSAGTIAIMAGDRWGNMVSLIYSNFAGFGSGVTVPGYGFVLHNRGSLFSLDPEDPNVVAPRKRPFHTLVPAFVMKDGKPVLAFGTPGGSGQPQSHLAALINMIDLGMNVQAASDAARFEHDQESNVLEIESNLYELVGQQLAAMGHTVKSVNGDGMGGLQLVQFTPAPGTGAPKGNSIKGDPPVNGVYRAGSDMRKDGQAVGW